MTILSGDIQALNRVEATVHPVGADVLVRQGGKTIGRSTVNADDSFSVEIDDSVRGEVEIILGLHNAASTLVELEGNDVHVTMLYSNVNNYFA